MDSHRNRRVNKLDDYISSGYFAVSVVADATKNKFQSHTQFNFAII